MHKILGDREAIRHAPLLPTHADLMTKVFWIATLVISVGTDPVVALVLGNVTKFLYQPDHSSVDPDGVGDPKVMHGPGKSSMAWVRNLRDKKSAAVASSTTSGT